MVQQLGIDLRALIEGPVFMDIYFKEIALLRAVSSKFPPTYGARQSLVIE